MQPALSSKGAMPKTNMSPYQGSYAQTQTQPVSGVFKTPVSQSYPQQGNNPGIIPPTPKPTTPVKKVTQPDGTTVEYHAPTQAKDVKAGATITDTSGNQGVAKFDPMTGKAYETPTPTQTPTPLTVGGQTPGVLASGQQTGNEAQTQKAVADAGAMTQWEQDVKNGMAVEEANKRLTDFRTQLAQQYGNIESQTIPLQFQQGREQVLARQAASQESALQSGVTNALSNQQQQFTAAQQQAQRGATTAQGAYSGAQTQAARATQAGENILGAVAPQYGVQYGTQVGQPGLPNGGLDSSLSGVTTGANVQSIKDLTGQKNQLQSVFNGADANFRLLNDTAKQGGVNDTNVPMVNVLKQNIARGLTSSAAVTNFLSTLATVRSQYASILGGGTTTVDSQQRAASAIPDDISLGALESLRTQMASEAQNRIAGITDQVSKLTNQRTSSGSTGGSYTSNSGNTYNLPY